MIRHGGARGPVESWRVAAARRADAPSGADAAGRRVGLEVLPLVFKPAGSVGDLLVQHLNELEDEAERHGGIQALLAVRFAHLHKVGQFAA